ncbi:hypothetical protein QGP82_02935 [Leptothoe sp. LEGE 181152]|nr:hypothetical protein [Leptothoe sp. LEGE 181152]
MDGSVMLVGASVGEPGQTQPDVVTDARPWVIRVQVHPVGALWPLTVLAPVTQV